MHCVLLVLCMGSSPDVVADQSYGNHHDVTTGSVLNYDCDLGNIVELAVVDAPVGCSSGVVAAVIEAPEIVDEGLSYDTSLPGFSFDGIRILI